MRVHGRTYISVNSFSPSGEDVRRLVGVYSQSPPYGLSCVLDSSRGWLNNQPSHSGSSDKAPIGRVGN